MILFRFYALTQNMLVWLESIISTREVVLMFYRPTNILFLESHIHDDRKYQFRVLKRFFLLNQSRNEIEQRWFCNEC